MMGTWQVGEAAVSTFKSRANTNMVTFENLSMFLPGAKGIDDKWIVKHGVIKEVETDIARLLIGDVHLHCAILNEPYRPMKFVLSQADEPSIVEYDKRHEVEKDIEDEITVLTDLKVHPNPVTNTLNINYYLTEESEVSIYLKGLSGQVVQKVISLEGQSSGYQHNAVGVAHLSSGFYLVHIQAGKQCCVTKIIKQ